MDDTQRTTIPVEDLDLVFFRAQDAKTGRWSSVSAFDATDQQFHTWARSKVDVKDSGDPIWTLDERAGFCTFLWERHALFILNRQALEAEGE